MNDLASVPDCIIYECLQDHPGWCSTRGTIFPIENKEKKYMKLK